MKSCTVRMCCKSYLPILTLKRNICGLEMTASRLMIAILSVHLCCAMVSQGMVRVFTKHKQVIISALCPCSGDGGGRGGHGLSGLRRGSALLMIAPDCIFFFLIVRAQSVTGRLYRYSQCWVTLGLCAVPCNKRYHTLKNYKRSPRYPIGQIAGQLIKKCVFVYA